MRAQRIYVWLVAALVGITATNSHGQPAGQLPTHIVIARGDDAWSGRLRALQFLPTLGTLDMPAPPDLWEAARLIDETPPDNRRLWTFHRDDAPTRTPVALRWAAISPKQQTAIDESDGLGATRIDYLRGVRSSERGGSGLRTRSSALGSMLGSGVLLLGPPGFVLDARHTSFRQQHAQRPWTAYVGANDGMLHAFDALTGEERFAVMPDAVLAAAARNTSPGQPVPGPICSRPFVADAWTGAQWHSLLTCANGPMAHGLFLIDVTDPAASTPPPMLAYDTSDDATVGRVEGPIPIVPLTNGGSGQPRWFAISGNGKSSANIESRLLLLALDQPRTSPWQSSTVYPIRVPAGASRGGLGAPAVALNLQGYASFAYAADPQGQIWRFNLSGTPPWLNALGTNDALRRTPFFTATSRGGSAQSVLSPILLAASGSGTRLVFVATDAGGNATLYGILDTDIAIRNLSRNNLTGLHATEAGDGTVIRSGSNAASGWRLDLPAGQAPGDLTTAGTNGLLLTTLDAVGRQRAYLLDTDTGLPADKDGRTGHVITGTPIITTQNGPPTSTPSGAAIQTTYTRLWQLDGGRIRQLESRIYTRQLGRLSWREMTEGGTR